MRIWLQGQIKLNRGAKQIFFYISHSTQRFIDLVSDLYNSKLQNSRCWECPEPIRQSRPPLHLRLGLQTTAEAVRKWDEFICKIINVGWTLKDILTLLDESNIYLSLYQWQIHYYKILFHTFANNCVNDLKILPMHEWL